MRLSDLLLCAAVEDLDVHAPLQRVGFVVAATGLGDRGTVGVELNA